MCAQIGQPSDKRAFLIPKNRVDLYLTNCVCVQELCVFTPAGDFVDAVKAIDCQFGVGAMRHSVYEIKRRVPADEVLGQPWRYVTKFR